MRNAKSRRVLGVAEIRRVRKGGTKVFVDKMRQEKYTTGSKAID